MFLMSTLLPQARKGGPPLREKGHDSLAGSGGIFKIL